MFKILDAAGRTIRSSDNNTVVTVINPSRAIKLISSGHIDSVTAGYSTNAAISAQASATSAQASATSAEAAELSATNSQTSAGQSALSADAALAHKNDTITKAGEAATSASDAASVLGTANAALSSANLLNTVVIAGITDAAGYAGAASSSATAASGSATAAANSATTAEDAKDDAIKAATFPEGQTYTLSNNTTTGYSALHYAERAQDSYDAAALVQGTLDTTLTAAQAAAAVASQATIDAQNAINALAGSHTDFHTKYLGDFTADPTTGVSGAALAAGDLYYNTSTNLMRIYTATSGWVDQVTASSPVVKRTFIFEVPQTPSHSFSGADITGKTLTFTEDNLEVFLNGALMRDDEYSADPATNTVTIDTSVQLSHDDNVLITVLSPFALADVVTKANGGTFAGSVGFTNTTTFNGDLDVNANVDIAGRLTVEATGSPLVLDKTHSTSLVNQEHSVLGIKGNSATRGDIGIQNDQLYLQSRGGSSTTKTSGLQFRGTDISPRHNGALSDTVVDLGSTASQFKTIYTDNIVVRGLDAITDGLIPLSPENNDLNYQTVGNRKNLRMPAIVAGTNIAVTKTDFSTTLDCENSRLLAAGYYRPLVSPGNPEHILPANYWHAAVINDWQFQHPDYVTRTSSQTSASAGFLVPLDRKIFIEYGATMGFARLHSDYTQREHEGPLPSQGPLRLRLGCTTGLGSNFYEVSSANGYTTNGNYQQLAGSYITPASIGYTEFRIEGRWPYDVEGSWSREVVAGYDNDSNPIGPRVAWVRIWDTEIRNNE